jgi:hypothetical protein
MGMGNAHRPSELNFKQPPRTKEAKAGRSVLSLITDLVFGAHVLILVLIPTADRDRGLAAPRLGLG